MKKKLNLNTTFICEEQFDGIIRNTPERDTSEGLIEYFMHLVCLWDGELARQDNSKGDDAQCSVKGMRDRFRENMRRYAVGVLTHNADQIITGLTGMKKVIAELKLYELKFGWENEEEESAESEDED